MDLLHPQEVPHPVQGIHGPVLQGLGIQHQNLVSRVRPQQRYQLGVVHAPDNEVFGNVGVCAKAHNTSWQVLHEGHRALDRPPFRMAEPRAARGGGGGAIGGG
jgi:hypothetical protein